MTGHALLRRLRETQVLVCHPPDRDGDELVRHLKRIGAQVRQAWPAPQAVPPDTDVVFVLFDRSTPPGFVSADASFALVAIIDYEDPAVLNALVDADVRGVLTKPVRPFGILSTLITARAAHKYEARLHQKVAKLEETMRSRRDIEKSVQILVATRAVSEEAAYQMIRSEAMQQRRSMATVAASIISAHSVFQRFGSSLRDVPPS